ncbi:mono-functional DNA-alkylating methyl methanesulfonate N-term-domain-containing protein [Halteromyces radiatus]|uniref:mono-functional DNA-alkylating methyl methanesulfonate N-term-domain-containing protein n=1 Tax=Halteromyces radiatus TaxID=101107 RepID=UPI00221F60B7|nr:mono-functional DNA-alkylating methyl methanesulfonate N-term-domain-containing protein [Halteromyces radiatus]KAI8093553.1 mono-functional DNA-alkylating methyl methanesulfonate N-term-domain-containing protein [Halteromyces radiatus]
MNVCYRTSCYGTSIQRILRGSIFEKDNLDLVFVKNYSFQYLRIQTNHSTGKTDNDLITPIFEQQAFGTILDARLLSCDFQDQSLPTLETSNSSNQDQQPYTQETRFGHTTIQGNDIILALTDYGQLVFCTLVGQPPDLSSTGRFECVANITLDKPGLEFDKVNKKLAVDPWSRAIAIASYQDRLDIMILNDTMSRTHFSPAAGMGSIYEEGIIWHMEFLHSETSSWDHILLAAIVYNDTDKICRIIVYSIDGSDPELATIKLVGRLPLDRKTPLPVLLIPLPCYPESFIIVTESTVSVLSADDISCGNVLYPVLPICDAIDHTDPYQDILITSYSFCVDPTLPILCLGTAEGYLLQLDISDLDLMKWKIVKKVHAIGQQMCMLGLIRIEGENVEPTAEVLLYSGESADGQILAIIAGNDNQEQSICYIMQNLMNRAPLIDWQAIRKTGQPDKIIACSGQDEQGSLHTISYDCDSSILYTSENNWNGTTKMWCFSHTLNCVYLVASSSFNTRWIALDNENNMNDDVSMTIQTDTCTIFAGSLKMETLGFIIIQILRNQILLSNLDGERLLYHEPKSEYQILFATAWNSRNHSYISVCMSTGEDHMVQVYACQLSKSTSTLELCLCCQTVLSSAPSCFYRFAMEDQEGNTFDILVVGMYDSKVILQLFDSTTSQLITLEIIDCHDIPHSFATIYYSEQLMSLLIGTRTGKLLTVDLSPKLQRLPSWQILITNRDQIQALGSCPVLLCVSQENGLVFASSDSIWLIGYDDKDARLVIEAVYNHDLKNIEALLPLISIGDIQDQYNGNKLALVADGRLYVLQVKKKVQLVTRKLVLSSTPRKHLLHDHSTSYLVTSSNYKGKVYHHLKLIDHCNGEVLCEHRFDKGETVLALSSNEKGY